MLGYLIGEEVPLPYAFFPNAGAARGVRAKIRFLRFPPAAGELKTEGAVFILAIGQDWTSLPHP